MYRAGSFFESVFPLKCEFLTIGEGGSDGAGWGLCLWGPSYQILELAPRSPQIHFATTPLHREIEMVLMSRENDPIARTFFKIRGQIFDFPGDKGP